ncbi:F-box/LRR-repeat protein At4g14103-like [Papaver somniferum]|uniref:F-box/LRR-repeat protein At4g14103-like n=1 Tax=Papaver somniferum TaxID=3469 RepID=UPI000E6FB17B|nr:F-box/LRR-repeat protein At4g14103-like [Papaver somniferum]
MSEGEDRITNLPDSIIHEIFSFLDIKWIIRTSALSKRWKRISASIPFLELGRFSLRGMSPEKFMDTVDKVLHFHDMSNIKILEIYWSGINWPEGKVNASRVNLWLSTAIMRNIEDLTLNIELSEPFRIPLSLVTCESLIILELSLSQIMYLPSCMSLPRLKDLKLCQAKFSDGYNKDSLFSGCPVLEHLRMDSCDWSDVKSFCITTPALKQLEIIGSDDYDNWDLKSNGLLDCSLRIHAPNLVSLTYWDDLPKEYDLSSFPALVDADICFDQFVGDATTGDKIGVGAAASKFLRALSYAKCLTLSHRTIKSLSYAEDLQNNLPTFHHLKDLTVELKADTDEVLVVLLQSAPNLESLVFDRPPRRDDVVEGGDNQNNEDDSLELDMMGSGCSFLRPKRVFFKVFVGTPSQMRWAKLIVKEENASQTMTVGYTNSYDCIIWKSENQCLLELPIGLSTRSASLFNISSSDCLH